MASLELLPGADRNDEVIQQCEKKVRASRDNTSRLRIQGKILLVIGKCRMEKELWSASFKMKYYMKRVTEMQNVSKARCRRSKKALLDEGRIQNQGRQMRF